MTEEQPPKIPYRRFSKLFDVTTDWRGLSAVLGRRPFYVSRVDAPPPSAQRWLEGDWAAIDKKFPGWRDDLRATAAEVVDRLSASLRLDERTDTVLSLLIDQSGSMRGDKMRLLAAALDISQAALTGLGLKVEVLGFTTVFWRGGRSRWWWRLFGGRKMPGRLNDLLHVVYRDAAEPAAGETIAAYREMTRPELLKENIDGEALEWAVGRLRQRTEERKVLLVVSDGAPVDDSTLHANHGCYMVDHLLDVIARLDEVGGIELQALGIGYSVERYYPQSAHVEAPEEVGVALLGQIERLLTS